MRKAAETIYKSPQVLFSGFFDIIFVGTDFYICSFHSELIFCSFWGLVQRIETLMIFQERQFGNFVEKVLQYRYFLKNFLKQKFMGCKLVRKITNLIRVQRKVSHKSNSKVEKQNMVKTVIRTHT